MTIDVRFDSSLTPNDSEARQRQLYANHQSVYHISQCTGRTFGVLQPTFRIYPDVRKYAVRSANAPWRRSSRKFSANIEPLISFP